jgi:hypothetical protein
MLKGKSLYDKVKAATDEWKYTEKSVQICFFYILNLHFFVFIVTHAYVDPT